MSNKVPNYNQDEVNQNMEKMFDMTPTIGDKMKNIIRSDKVTVVEAVTEKQSEKPKRTYTKKASPCTLR